MNESEYNKIKKKVGYALTKYKATHYDAEDITQEVVLMWAERGFKKGQSIDYAVIDFLRKYTGRKGSVGYDSRTKLQNPAGLDDGLKYQQSAGLDLGERRNTWGFERFFYGEERAILLLITKWGFSETEVGDLFGVTGGRICQRYKIIQGRISTRIKAAELRIERARKDKVARILPKEKTRGPGVEQQANERMAREEPRKMGSFNGAFSCKWSSF